MIGNIRALRVKGSYFTRPNGEVLRLVGWGFPYATVYFERMSRTEKQGPTVSLAVLDALKDLTPSVRVEIDHYRRPGG